MFPSCAILASSKCVGGWRKIPTHLTSQLLKLSKLLSLKIQSIFRDQIGCFLLMFRPLLSESYFYNCQSFSFNIVLYSCSLSWTHVIYYSPKISAHRALLRLIFLQVSKYISTLIQSPSITSNYRWTLLHRSQLRWSRASHYWLHYVSSSMTTFASTPLF